MPTRKATSPAEPRLIARARQHGERPALVAPEGAWSYAELLQASEAVAFKLQVSLADLCLFDRFPEPTPEALRHLTLGERPVAFLVPSGLHAVAALWGIWRAGGIAVPLCTAHPLAELLYVVDDVGAAAILTGAEHEETGIALSERRGIVQLDASEASSPRARPADWPPLAPVSSSQRALIVYTSGTTSRPKGAVWTHAGLRAQVEMLVAAWGWRPQDRALCVLPLHHVHGLVNVVTCALWAGACCELLPAFDADAVWERIGSGDITVFMAVPTIYFRLIGAWEGYPPGERERLSRAAGRLRLMVSGSAALPVQTLERWREITGHTLLERYGMTEIGMALSNPLDGERVAGTVGMPLPGVEVRRVDDDGHPAPDDEPGEIEVRGRGLFREYWRRSQESAAAFHDGWFATGDIAVVEDGYYRILGRASVDIVKCGGYKLSALEIEAALRDHPAIADCAVVGIPDPEWGERVAVALVHSPGASPLTLESLRDWARDRLAPYKLPTRLRIVEELPRNALGKVTKRAVAGWFSS
jgi:malonyl-CoA/methylmalonyl-CoA synthetase